jgi:hypothetical protein
MATAKKVTTEETDIVKTEISENKVDWFAEREKESAEKREKRIQIQSALNEQFPQEVERQLKKGGTTLTYIPVSEVITRLNKVLGFDGWSYQIVKCERDAIDPDFIVAHVRLDVFPETDKFCIISKDGFGGQKIKRTKAGDIVDLGDEFKGAVSDALKKAAQALGVGLYLARTEEAMEAVDAPPAPVVVEVPINPEIADLWENFISFSKSLDADGKVALNSFWTGHASGRPKPTKQTATVVDLEALIAECIKISFNGTDAKNE